MALSVDSKALDRLDDACFAYVEPGGQLDAEGKTIPRKLRHYPISTSQGVRDSLARIAMGGPFAAQALPKVKAAARRFGLFEDIGGIQDSAPRRFAVPAGEVRPSALVDEHRMSAAARLRESVAAHEPALGPSQAERDFEERGQLAAAIDALREAAGVELDGNGPLSWVARRAATPSKQRAVEAVLEQIAAGRSAALRVADAPPAPTGDGTRPAEQPQSGWEKLERDRFLASSDRYAQAAAHAAMASAGKPADVGWDAHANTRRQRQALYARMGGRR